MPPYIPEQLQEIAAKVAQGQEPNFTVRTFLSWFWGAQRRGSFIVSVMRAALSATNLRTVPDFDETYIDGAIKFVSAVTEAVASNGNRSAGEINLQVADAMVMVDSASAQVKVDQVIESRALNPLIRSHCQWDPMHR